MRLQTGATQVALRTSQLLRAGHGRNEAPILEPLWYRVVLANPPTQQLLPRVRRLESPSKAQEHSIGEKSNEGFWITRQKPRQSVRAKHLYQLPRVEFPEDRIRDMFYRTHPWELARPRNLVETDGQDLARCDWAQLDQPHIRLSGENVVRHALWLTEQPGYSNTHGNDWRPAYNEARHKFYKLRMAEFAEQQVAAEEAAMIGAVFGPSAIETGIEAEQRVIDAYVAEAKAATNEKRARGANMMASDEDAPAAAPAA